MTATLDDVTKKKAKAEPSAQEQVAEELVRRAREQGLSLTGPDRLLMQVIHDPGDQSEQGDDRARRYAKHGRINTVTGLGT